MKKKKTKNLRNDRTISFGKNLLELIKKNFKKFQWIIIQDTDEIKETYGISRVRTSIKTTQKMH